MGERLPIYRVEPEEASVTRLIELGKRLFDISDDFKLSETNDGLVLRSGERVIDMATASGGVWAADESQLWKPSIYPELPDDEAALEKANELAKQHGLLPELEGPFQFGKPVVGGTYFSLTQEGKRDNRRLDVQVIYPIQVGDLRVVGGGADFTITLGHESNLIGFSGGWRRVGESFEAQMIERERADEQFRDMMSGVKLESYDASLAYYAAPAFQKQEFLYPVYVYRATAMFGEERVTLRQVMLPATDFGPPVVFGEPQPSRRSRNGKKAELKKEARRNYATQAASVTQAATLQMAARPAARAMLRPWEAGASWIGLSGGLAGSQANAQGFIDEWAAANWRIDFNWGDANAFESDWRRNDDAWVDNADFVFYTGHANMNGWVLSNPDDGFLDFAELGASPQSPGDLWGNSDLEWAVIAACGPLHDDVIVAGGGDVFNRWEGAFDGMHILMGYGAVTFDNTEEGRRLSQYAKGGSTLISAWFRAAQEIQPATNGEKAPDGPVIWVGAMWVGRGTIDPVNDHAWDFGSVSADPTAPTWYAAMWTTC
jgi:hypothetical protein